MITRSAIIGHHPRCAGTQRSHRIGFLVHSVQPRELQLVFDPEGGVENPV